MRITGKAILSLVLTLLFLFFIIVGLSYNSQARAVPLVVAIPIFFVSIAQLVSDLRAPAHKEKKSAGADESSTAEAKENEPEGAMKKKRGMKSITPRQEMGAIGWVVGFIGAIIVLGYIIAIPVFVFLFTRFHGKEKWLNCIIETGVCWAVVYLVFVIGIKAYIYPGLIANLF